MFSLPLLLFWCLLHCFATINGIFSCSLTLSSILSIISILNLFSPFLFHSFLLSLCCISVMIAETIHNIARVHSGPLGSLFCYSWFKNRLIIQKPLQCFVYQTATQMKSQFCPHLVSSCRQRQLMFNCKTWQPTYQHWLVMYTSVIWVFVLAGMMSLKEKDSCISCVNASRYVWSVAVRCSVQCKCDSLCSGQGEGKYCQTYISHLIEDSLWLPPKRDWIMSEDWEQCVWELTKCCTNVTLEYKKNTNLFGLNRFFFCTKHEDGQRWNYLSFFLAGHSCCCHLWWSGWEWP